MADRAPIRGRWTGELNKLDQLLVEGSILGGGAGAAKIGEARAIVASLLARPPVPDEAAIERASRAIYELTRGARIPGVVNGLPVKHVGTRQLALAVLRAAPETPDGSDPGAGHETPERGQETPQSDWRTVNAFGRSVTLEVGGTIDGCGQFRVALLVDGKERFAGYFTDKSPDA